MGLEESGVVQQGHGLEVHRLAPVLAMQVRHLLLQRCLLGCLQVVLQQSLSSRPNLVETSDSVHAPHPHWQGTVMAFNPIHCQELRPALSCWSRGT
jgi:hypothetical protein